MKLNRENKTHLLTVNAAVDWEAGDEVKPGLIFVSGGAEFTNKCLTSITHISPYKIIWFREVTSTFCSFFCAWNGTGNYKPILKPNVALRYLPSHHNPISFGRIKRSLVATADKSHRWIWWHLRWLMFKCLIDAVLVCSCRCWKVKGAVSCLVEFN